MRITEEHADVVMLGTFSAWRLGTLQARALPIAQELARDGLRVTIITTPWDEPTEGGVRDIIAGVRLINTRSTSLSAFPQAVAEMIALTRAMNPSVVQVFKPRGFGGLAGRRLAREFPLIVDCDDWEGDGGWNQLGSYPAPLRRLFDWQERALIRSARAVSAASTLLELRARKLRNRRASESVMRVPNGLTGTWASTLASARQRGPSDAFGTSEPTILVYSRFEEIHADWLGQFCHALDQKLSSPVRISVVGPSQRSVCDRVYVKVDLLGYVARELLPDVLGRTSVAVFPLDDSLVARSKQSVKLLELMASGCPIVASDVGDVPAVLGDAGVTIRGSDPSRFAEEVLALVQDPQRRDGLSRRACVRASSHFTTKQSAEAMRQVYRWVGGVGI